MVGLLLTILIFGGIVVFHEFGHFIVAKKNGVAVLEFAIGMGPKLFSIHGDETEYSLRLLPLGGYCRMEDGLDEDGNITDDPNGFYGKSVFRRILIVVAGPVFNFILAWILSAFIIGSFGYDPAVILSVSEGQPMEAAGMQAGDRITEINGKKIYLYRQLSAYLQFHQEDFAEGKEVTLTYIRDGEKNTVTVAPVERDGYWYLGFSGTPNYRLKANPLQVVGYSFCETTYWVDVVFQSLKMLFNGQAHVSDLSGPVGVAQVVEETYQESSSDGWFFILLNMLNIAIMLSANLGVINLLPLPALDGGRLLSYLVEIVRRKQTSPRTEGIISTVGMALLLLLGFFVMAQDILRLIH